jgi:hypothetical protein
MPMRQIPQMVWKKGKKVAKKPQKMIPKKKEIVFIGQEFYWKSQTAMSSIYQKLPNGTFERYDWGYAQGDLENGFTLTMRPATEKEKAYFEGMLKGKA